MVKNRNGFVSNSSSSSFVVIDASNGYIDKNEFFLLAKSGTKYCYTFGNRGCTEFGLEINDYNNVFDRINFAYLQCLYSGRWQDERIELLENVICDFAGDDRPIEWLVGNDSDSENWGYIDHQSNASECENEEIFQSKQVMEDFLFGVGSLIHTDNDHHE